MLLERVLRESKKIPSSNLVLGAAFVGMLSGYLLLQYTLQGDWIRSPGMWAENGTNYFSVSYDGFRLGDLGVTDSGYLPIILRLVSAILHAVGVPIHLVPLFQQAIALLIASLPVLFFIHPVFRIAVPSDLARGLLASVVLAFQSSWGLGLFLNSTYSFVFFLFSFALLLLGAHRNHRPTKWTPHGLWWLVPLTVFSKPAALAVMPLFLYLAIKSTGRIRAISGLVLVAGTFQFVVMAYSRFYLGVFDRGASFSLGPAIRDFFGYLFGMTTRLVIGPQISDVLSSLPGLGLGVALVLIIVIVSSREPDGPYRTLVFSGLVLALSALGLNGVTIWAHWNPAHWGYLNVPVHSHTIAPYLGLIVTLFSTSILVFRTLLPSLNSIALRGFAGFSYLIIWLGLSGWGALIYAGANQPDWPVTKNSQWAHTTNFTHDSGVFPDCVLLDPWGWVMGAECESAGFTDPRGENSRIPEGFEWLTSDLKSLPSNRQLFGVAVGTEGYPGEVPFWEIIAFDSDGNQLGSGGGSGGTDSRKQTILMNFDRPISIDSLAAIQLSHKGFSLIGRQNADGAPEPIYFFLLSKERPD